MRSYPFAQIDLAALRHNLEQVKKFAPHSKIMSVIKADAYGHSAIKVANSLSDSNAYAVARLDEGVLLRQQGIEKPIILLEGVLTAAEFEQAAAYQLSPVFHHVSQLQTLQLSSLSQPLQHCWIMVDTGMHRLGIRPDSVADVVTALAASDKVQGEVGLMSHFANADVVGDERNQQQLNHMLSLKQQLNLTVCFANSAAVCSLPEAHFEWVRPGLMLYGISPFEDKTGAELGLLPVMQLKTRLMSTYQVEPGEQVGYGGEWTATEATTVGVASIGYGDGYSRLLSNQSEVLVNGHLLPVIGRVSMDTICINLNAASDSKAGDDVVVWGDKQLAVETLALLAQTIPYELVTVICQRVQKEFING